MTLTTSTTSTAIDTLESFDVFNVSDALETTSVSDASNAIETLDVSNLCSAENIRELLIRIPCVCKIHACKCNTDGQINYQCPIEADHSCICQLLTRMGIDISNCKYNHIIT
jgi:hypothetical protein